MQKYGAVVSVADHWVEVEHVKSDVHGKVAQVGTRGRDSGLWPVERRPTPAARGLADSLVTHGPDINDAPSHAQRVIRHQSGAPLHPANSVVLGWAQRLLATPSSDSARQP